MDIEQLKVVMKFHLANFNDETILQTVLSNSDESEMPTQNTFIVLPSDRR